MTDAPGNGLRRYGVVARTPVRPPATDPDGYRICSECGQPVGRSQGPQNIQRPNLVDEDLVDRVGTSLPVFGWRCERHTDPVVLALPTDANADTLGKFVSRDYIAGWTGVRLRFADETARYVAVPRKEVTTIE